VAVFGDILDRALIRPLATGPGPEGADDDKSVRLGVDFEFPDDADRDDVEFDAESFEGVDGAVAALSLGGGARTSKERPKLPEAACGVLILANAANYNKSALDPNCKSMNDGTYQLEQVLPKYVPQESLVGQVEHTSIPPRFHQLDPYSRHARRVWHSVHDRRHGMV
jgi:hypothetical protein